MYNRYKSIKFDRSKIMKLFIHVYVDVNFAQSNEVEWRGMQSVFNTDY